MDAAIVAVAERLKLTRVATTDRSHLSRIIPAHADVVALVP